MTGNAPARFHWRVFVTFRAGGGVPHDLGRIVAGA